MRLKIKHCIIPMLMASFLILTSCDSENYLSQVSFDVTYSNFDFDFDNKTIELFCSREKMISFFTSDQHGMGNYFYSDLEEFENNYGFDNYAIVYYASAINAGYSLNLYISEISDESISLSFTYHIPDKDVLPAAIELV